MTDDYRAGELPDEFDKRVFDLEIKIQLQGVKQDDNQIQLLSELMGLYSVSENRH